MSIHQVLFSFNGGGKVFFTNEALFVKVYGMLTQAFILDISIITFVTLEACFTCV